MNVQICRCLFRLSVGVAVVGTGSVALARPGSVDEWKVPDAAAAKANPIPWDGSGVVAAKTLFVARCSSCHGSTGKGDGPAAFAFKPTPKDLADFSVMDQSDGALFWKMSEGRLPMPGFGSVLSDEHRWQIVQFIRTLGPTPPRFDASADLRGAISAGLMSYGRVQLALAKGDGAGAVEAGKSVTESVAHLRTIDAMPAGEKESKAWKEHVDALAADAAALDAAGSDVVKLRAAFRKLSDEFVGMVQDFGHAEAGAVFVFGVANGKPAESAAWLQAEASPVDPYGSGAAAEAIGPGRQLGSKRSQGAQPQRKKS